VTLGEAGRELNVSHGHLGNSAGRAVWRGPRAH
jgi:hypothetical protein